MVATELRQTNNFVMDENMKKAAATRPQLKSEDVAEAVLYVLATPPHVQVSFIRRKN